MSTISGSNSSTDDRQARPAFSRIASGCRAVRGRVWTRGPGAGRAQEMRRTGESPSTTPTVPTSSSESASEDGTGLPRCAGKTRPAYMTAGSPVRTSTHQETNAPSVRVCEVCRAGSCLITRRPAAGTQCLCTVELHVPLDGSDDRVSLHHECASCRNDRYAEMEDQRKKRVGSALFVSSFSAVPCPS
jgi:hypothetical protein